MNSIQSDEDNEHLFPWLAIIGMITMYWTSVERHIDQCVHFLHVKQPTNAKRAKKKTRLNDKLDFIKGNIPNGIVEIDQLEFLVERTIAAVKIRDVFAHGTIERFDQNQIEIGKVNGKSDFHHIELFTINLEKLQVSAHSLTELVLQWKAIASMLFEMSQKN